MSANSTGGSTSENAGNNSVFLHSCLVLLVRAGFVLVQLASIPTQNVFIIIYQNVIDIALSIASFGSVGYVIAFGDDFIGIIGYKKWFSFGNATDIHNAIIGLLASLIAMGIVTTILCGRMSMFAYFLVIFLLSGLIQPAVIHWVWHTAGWLYSKQIFSTEVSFKDHSGGLTIHVFGGMVSLIGALFFGRRLILLSSISELSIGVESPGSSFVGYIFIIVGLMGFSLTSFDYGKGGSSDNSSGILIINNLAGMSGGILTVVFLQHIMLKGPISYWNVLRCVQGGVAGIVTIAPGVDQYTPEIAFLAAVLSSAVFYFVSILIMRKTSIEDYCNVISIHLVCGMIGLFFSPLVGNSDSIKQRLLLSLWQLLTTLTVVLFLIVVCSNLFIVLRLCKKLRNKMERIDHERGVVAIKNQGRDKTFLDRVFAVSSTSPFLEPGLSGRNPSRIQSNDAPPPVKRVKLKRKRKKPKKKSDSINDSLPVRNVRFAYTIAHVANSDHVTENHFRNSSGDYLYNKIQLDYLKDIPTFYDIHHIKKRANFFCDDPSSKKNFLNRFVTFQKI